jgi:hypothetical protein
VAAVTISLTVFSGRLLAMMWMSGASPASAIGEVGQWIVRHIAHHKPRHVLGRRVEQNDIAVRSSAMHVKSCDRAVTASTVLDHKLDLALLADLGRDQPRKGIDTAAGRYRN